MEYLGSEREHRSTTLASDDVSGPDIPSGSVEESAEAASEADCPMAETHDKYEEAHFFLEQMMVQYHNPQPFRWNLNAFIQALRSVTFFLQKELTPFAGFRDWYAHQQDEMRGDELLRKFVEGRNVVVKERNLVVNSTAEIGMFRYRQSKLGMFVPVSPHLPSAYLLSESAPKLRLIPEEHPAIGEEYGVRRTWQVPELGEGNVLVLCDRAWSRIGHVVANAHKFLGLGWSPPPPHGHDPTACDLLTETDVNPALAQKWGW